MVGGALLLGLVLVSGALIGALVLYLIVAG